MSFSAASDWPVDLKIFELEPGDSQLVFAGDTLPVDCKVSNDKPVTVYWMRQGLRVTNNRSAGISLLNSEASEIVTLTLQ